MPILQQCSKCGAVILPGALEGLCPKCLSAAAFLPNAPPAVAPETAPGALSETIVPSLESLTRIRYFGDYELLGVIERGGMGVVFKAQQMSLKRIVALKLPFFNSSASHNSMQRFQIEAETIAKLDHPNIVPVYETGRNEGLHYISMKLIDGHSLAREHLGGPLPPRRSAELIAKTARAVFYAHQHGILHRDLKPGNVVLDAHGEPYVTDFGLAKLSDSDTNVTQTNAVMGSLAYMPPEQARGQAKYVTTAADVYSLGAILYELLTARPPFGGESAVDVIQQVLGRDPVSPRYINPQVDRDLETICLKCLEKEPQRRYGSAEALAEDLERWLRQEPILARPIRTVERVTKWAKRKPAIAGLTVAVIGIATIGLAGVLWQWRIAESARSEAMNRAIAETRARRELHALSYVSDMNLALQAYHAGEHTRAFDLLRRYDKPGTGEADLRGFEWRHLWWLCRGDYSKTLPAHKSVVGDLLFSPDGRIVATYAWNDTVRLWDLQSHKRVLELTNAASLGCFAEHGDIFVSAGRDGLIRFFRIDTGDILRSVPEPGEAIAFSAGANIAVIIDQEETLRAIDLTTLQAKLTIPGATSRRSDFSYVANIALSRDGRVLAAVEPSRGPHRLERGIGLWDVETGKTIRTLHESREIRCLHFSPDGNTLAIGCGNGDVVLRSLALPQGESLTIRATAGLPVLSLAFSPDGRSLATGGSDQTIRLWEAKDGSPRLMTFRGQIGDVWSLAFSPDGTQLASGSRDCTVKVWDLQQRPSDEAPIGGLLAEHWGNFTFSPDSRLMAAGCKMNVVKVWEIRTLRLVATLPSSSFVVAFSRDGRSLLTSSADEVARWWDLEANTSQPIPRYNGSVNGSVASFDLSPDRRLAALGHYDGRIELLDIDSGLSTTWRAHHTNAVLSVAFSPLGDKLVTGGRDRSVRVWDVRSQKVIGSSSDHRGGVCAVAFSSDGTLIASGCGASTIKFWNSANTRIDPIGSVSSHESAIRTLAFTPDGRTLASGSEDNTVKLWNVATEKEVTAFKYDSHIRMVAFSPDGNNLAVITDAGTLSLLRAATLEEVGRNFE